MMKVQIVNRSVPDCVLSVHLPEAWEVLHEKLEAAGIAAGNYTIRNVTCYAGFVEEIVHDDERIELLNELAIRLKQLPVVELEKLAWRCEQEEQLTFHKMFCFLDERIMPRKPKEFILYLPAAIQMVRCDRNGKAHAWCGEKLTPAAAERYLDGLQRYLYNHLMPETGLRGLACYFPEGGFKRKLFSVQMELVIKDKLLFGKFSCQLTEWLEEEEEKELKDALVHILTFGWGRTFHYDGYPVEGGLLRLSFSGAGAKLEKKRVEQIDRMGYITAPEMITVEVYPEWAKGDMVEEMAELIALPLDDWQLTDWLEKMRVTDEKALSVAFFASAVTALEEYFWMEQEMGSFAGSLSGWNRLAGILSQMDEVMIQNLNGLVREAPQGLEVSDLIQLTESVLACHVLSEGTLEQLFIEQGYQRNKGCSYRAGYQANLDEMIQLLFWDEEEKLLAHLVLPKDRDSQIYKDWDRVLNQAASVRISCRIPALSRILYEELEHPEEILHLSEQLKILEERGTITKYKAILELLPSPDLSDCLMQSANMNQYDFYADCRTFEEAGWRFFEERLGRTLTEEEKESIRFREYGKRMLLKAGGVETSYGYVVPKTNAEKDEE